MAYIEGRVVHDADAHIMETPAWLPSYADPDVRERIGTRRFLSPPIPNEVIDSEIDAGRVEALGLDESAATLMARKNWRATGSFDPADRVVALDLLGVTSQLVFNTFHNGWFVHLERTDPDLAYGAATAHNRGLAEWCSADARLLPTGYVPLADLEPAPAAAREALDLGAAALLVASHCPANHSPSHVGLDPVWAMAQEAGIPIVFHVGGGEPLLEPAYFENGLPTPPDFHGGEENFRSVDYMAIPGPVMQTLATMVFDGVLERFPRLMFGVIEQGATWLPSWCKHMESAVEAFGRHEERLQALSLRPTEYVQRQVRATPYPAEDVGWIVDQVGPEVCLFSTDYPHVEGGRRPYERFETSLADRPDLVRAHFYARAFEELMGEGLPRQLRTAA
jgi:predicted TIM-barrel fold metal-dependent hydrolase